ncbi:hypothetical protein [Corynebacterium massiliense]|uniref:SPOR domain-containing protein n=1 Tax=Corynebacterium massiliense DSM 45435 TaxID=1121364 RepID=A0ABY7U7S7_9CORY|nr:hypothetical protein [Corynebacterium massiliense]WCZ32115.1 hypothetical protein CMASS_03305 [Corynebacterium massiliense DSM 45435]
MGKHSAPRKQRRRATRTSDTPDYDRSADRAPFYSAFDDAGTRVDRGADAAREVQLDEDAPEDEPRGDEFWEEQRPPHY